MEDEAAKTFTDRVVFQNIMAKTIEVLTIADLVRTFTCSSCENEIRTAYYVMVRVPGTKRKPSLSDGDPFDFANVHYKCKKTFLVFNPGEWEEKCLPAPVKYWAFMDGDPELM